MKRLQWTMLVPFIAVVAYAAASDISGKWHFLMTTPGGDRDASAEFAVSGNQVSGKWDTAEVKGTCKDGVFDLAFPMTSPEAGITATFTLKGKLEDGKLTGSWSFGEWSGTFTATRAQ